jgi:1-acyl-sn-glycerol-3-phosphate acyltransferase
VGTALSTNVFTPLVVVAIVAAWALWLRMSWGRPPIRIPQPAVRWGVVLVPAIVLAYGVLRNIPVAPLKALAP